MKLKRLILMQLVVSLTVASMLLPGCSCNDSGKSGARITLLQTTDMHDIVSPKGNEGGFARLASKIKEIRAENEEDGIPVLLIDSGDFTMGSVYDLLWDTDPAPFKFLQAMDYDVVTFGNHEYDYNPERLGIMFNKAIELGFDIPVVLTNTVFDGESGTADDALEELASGASPYIVTTYIKTLDIGIKVGFIGLVGKTADDYAPNATPITFKSDYSDSAVIADIQSAVNTLRTHCDIVIALSHSGVTGTDTDTPGGDDITLAENVSGINIIASGYEHETTDEVISVTNETTGHKTYIICAGSYTTNLLELEFYVNKKKKSVSDIEITNHAISSSVAEDSDIKDMISGSTGFDTQINTILSAASLPEISDTVASIAFDLQLPEDPAESGIGNLIADAFRWAGSDGVNPTFGACANGIIRNYYTSGSSILFSDLFSTLPLGMTLETDQDPLYPGYTLHKVYVTGAEIWDICQFIARIKQFNVPKYNPYFCNLSGLKFTYDADYAVTAVQYYGAADYKCTAAPAGNIADNATVYPIIVDSYVLAMLLSDSIQGLLGGFNLSIKPKLSDESTLVTTSNMNRTRLDISGASGVQEYQTWRSLYNYMDDATTGLNGTIPSTPYGSTTPLRIVGP
ncbi:MAG TPA: 5'-nucleotidase C-terminal domain-containing protein [Spirochaetota bacterium]|nr:5'-nucleotidase C-terminal domain-containing protein [Spirochaetota bacterium]